MEYQRRYNNFMDDVLDYKLDYKSIDFYQPFNYYDVQYISINF